MYKTKNAACAAFRVKHPAQAKGLKNDQLVEHGYVDEDEPGGPWVINNPDEFVEENEFEAGMAEELAQRQAAAQVAEGHIDETQHPMLAGRASSQITVHNVALPKSGLEGNCPHCGKSTRDGHETRVTEFSELSPGSQNSTTQQFTCNQCAGEWGPVVDKPKRARAPSGSSNGLKIETNRPEQNGVKRPSAGGKCRGVWDMLDAIGPNATAKEARARATELGFDKTTTMVQFYRWRKFNGIEGRQ
jgi:hypothetical protein